jgi:protein disulfide-isomerase
MKLISMLVMSLFTWIAAAADLPYDDSADARLEIKQALVQAGQAGVPVIVVFGANWCPDCRVLDMAIKSGASAALMARDFKVVKVNVGRFDKNLDIAEQYGVPLKKGIPAVAILSPRNDVLYATKSGELADARAMGDAGIHDFLTRASVSLKSKN